MAASCIMRQIEEKHVLGTAQVKFMVWSSRIDLVALANVNGEINLHRLSWQKVWTKPSPAEGVKVVAMAWRPDGNVLAAAYSNGQVSLLDIETSDAIHQFQQQEKVTCLTWEQRSGSQPLEDHLHYKDESNTFLPKLPPLSKGYGASSSATAKQDNYSDDPKRLKSQSDLNLLALGTQDGHIYAYAYGIFPTCHIDLSDHIISPDESVKSIVDVAFTQDFTSLSCIADMGSHLSAINLEIPLLSCRAREIQVLATKYGQLQGLLDYLEKTMQALQEAWESVLLELDSKLSSYAKSIPSTSSVSAEFLELLVFGVPTLTLENFLVQELTDKGLKRLGHAIELSYSILQKLMLKHVSNVGHAINFHVSDLVGLSLREDRFHLVGLQEKPAQTAFKAGGTFLAKAVEMQQVIESSMKYFKTFFRWLYVTILKLMDETVPPELAKMTQQDLRFIAEFLKENFGTKAKSKEIKEDTMDESITATNSEAEFRLERVGQYLKDQDLTIVYSQPEGEDMENKEEENRVGETFQKKSTWAEFLHQNTDLLQTGVIFGHNPRKSLVQEHKTLKYAIDGIFESIPNTLGQSALLQSKFAFTLAPAGASQPRFSHAFLSDNRGIQFVCKNGDNEIFLLESCCGGGKNASQVGFMYFGPLKQSPAELSSSGQRFNVLDVMFYTSEVISVLLKDATGEKESVYVQLGVKAARHSIAPVPSQYVQTSGQLANLMSPVPAQVLPTNVCVMTDASLLLEVGSYRILELFPASQFAVNGSRKVAAILSANRRKVRLYEMEVEDDDEMTEDSALGARESDQSGAQLEEDTNDNQMGSDSALNESGEAGAEESNLGEDEPSNAEDNDKENSTENVEMT